MEAENSLVFAYISILPILSEQLYIWGEEGTVLQLKFT